MPSNTYFLVSKHRSPEDRTESESEEQSIFMVSKHRSPDDRTESESKQHRLEAIDGWSE